MDASNDVAERSALFRENAKRGRWTVTLQGDLLQAQQTGYRSNDFEVPPRNPCSPFSPGSRRRLLFRLARVKWPRREGVKFVTLTYPDEYKDRKFRRRTIDRDLFHRHVENYLGMNTAALWRTEWEVRKSGMCKGHLFPHNHLIIFTRSFLPHALLRQWWQSAIGWHQYVRTEVKLPKRVENAAHYAAKYLTQYDSPSLVYVSYLSNLPGRPWGIKRPRLVPWSPCRSIEDVPPALICALRERASRMYKPIGNVVAGGFTLLRDDVRKLFENLEQAVWTDQESLA